MYLIGRGDQDISTSLQILHVDLHFTRILCLLFQDKGKHFLTPSVSNNPNNQSPPMRTERYASRRAPREQWGLGTHSLDKMRVFDQAKGAPERVVDGSAVLLELRREPAVDHRAPARSLYQILQRRSLPLSYSHLSRRCKWKRYKEDCCRCAWYGLATESCSASTSLCRGRLRVSSWTRSTMPYRFIFFMQRAWS